MYNLSLEEISALIKKYKNAVTCIKYLEETLTDLKVNSVTTPCSFVYTKPISLSGINLEFCLVEEVPDEQAIVKEKE